MLAEIIAEPGLRGYRMLAPADPAKLATRECGPLSAHGTLELSPDLRNATASDNGLKCYILDKIYRRNARSTFENDFILKTTAIWMASDCLSLALVLRNGIISI